MTQQHRIEKKIYLNRYFYLENQALGKKDCRRGCFVPLLISPDAMQARLKIEPNVHG